MAHHDYMEELKAAATFLTQHGINYTVRRIRWTEKHDWFDDLKYQPQDLEWILNNTATAQPNTLIDGDELAHAMI